MHVLRLQMHVHWCTPFGVLDRAGSSCMAVGACQSFLPQCWCTFIAHGLVLQQAVTHALLGAVASAVARRNFILSHCYFGVAAHLHRRAGRESAAQTARSAAGLSGVPPCKVPQNIVQAIQIRAPRSIKTSSALSILFIMRACAMTGFDPTLETELCRVPGTRLGKCNAQAPGVRQQQHIVSNFARITPKK